MKREKISVHTPFIKLDSFLKLAGVAPTGGQCKELVLAGAILVDGQKCLMRGKKLYPGAVVTAEGIEYEVVSGEG